MLLLVICTATQTLFKEWTMYSVSLSNSGCTRIVGRARRWRKRCSRRSYLSALPTIQVHPELDGRTPGIVHCFYNIARHFTRRKVALIKLQILHVHVVFSLTALFATQVCARVVFIGSSFALMIFRRFRCFCDHFRQVF